MDQPMPHEGVFVRLGVSAIHGIGVFAQQAIKAGTNVFANDEREIHWVSNAMLEDGNVSAFARRLYADFAIRRGGQLGCPANFNLVTVGWYLNQPAEGDQPNMTATRDFALVALRDIEAGEELTLSYTSFDQERYAQSM